MLQASFYKHTLHFQKPSGTSRGILTSKDSWILKIWQKGKEEIIGLGECSIIEGLSYDNVSSIEEKLKEVCSNIDDYFYWQEVGLIDFPAIRFALETALLDLQNGGKQLLFSSPFTQHQEGIPINGLIWMGNYEEMQQQLEEKVVAGFSCIKVKIGAIDFQKEIELLTLIRQKYPEIELRVDANGAFNRDPKSVLNILASLGIQSIEQPISPGQTNKMAKLCEESQIPIALDEELIGVHAKEAKIKLLQTIRPQYIILKPSLLGGLRATKEWIDIAKSQNIGWWITSALESNIGLNAIAQWTATLNSPLHQGLGTGGLFTNNTPSCLYIDAGKLWHGQ